MTIQRNAIFAILTITACPQDDSVTSMSDTSSATTGSGDGPDMPGDGDGDPSESDTETSTPTGDGDRGTGDGDEEPSGDGDGDPSGDGDGDPSTGDGDGDGSEAVPYSLEVESNGNRIGYLMGVWDYGFFVWDDVNEVTFRVSQQTGHVTGRQAFYYTTADCSGQKYMIAPYQDPGACGNPGPPVRANVVGHDGAASGYVAATGLWMASGSAAMVMTQSVDNAGGCSPLAFSICAYAVVGSAVIPATFPLPITVVESTIDP
jgi:hypothetical protein